MTVDSVTSAPLPLSDHELEVAAFLLDGSPRSAARMFHASARSLVALNERAYRMLDESRPVLDTEELRARAGIQGDEDGPERRRDFTLWMLSRLERFALLGVCDGFDVRDDKGQDVAWVTFSHVNRAADILPTRLTTYANVLVGQIARRWRDKREPSSPERVSAR
ncbi:MAG: hypothetical protein M3O91_08875 [Chloroflexota bacterium]|nr:hypothetical protein [Chloroflexota bacterium]